MSDTNKDESVHANTAPVQITRFEISEKTLSVVALGVGAAAIVIACWAIHDAGRAEREARMYEYYTLEMDAKLIAAGVKKPDEAVSKQLGGKK